MTTTDLITGGVIAVFGARQVRSTFLEHLHRDGRTAPRDLAQLAAGAASGTALGAAATVLTDRSDGSARPSRLGWGTSARWVVSVGLRLTFLIWLYDVTDGAGLSPWGFAQDAFGGTVWHPVLVALGLTEVVGRVAALAVRRVRSDGGRSARPHRC